MCGNHALRTVFTKSFSDHQTKGLMILNKSSDILKKSSDISVEAFTKGFSDDRSDDFEQIIRHFAKSSAICDGLMAFREHCKIFIF